jgi:hypothetical protein
MIRICIPTTRRSMRRVASNSGLLSLSGDLVRQIHSHAPCCRARWLSPTSPRCGSSPHSSRNRTARPPPSGCTNSCRTLPFGFDGPACVIGASRAIAASCHFPGTLYGRSTRTHLASLLPQPDRPTASVRMYEFLPHASLAALIELSTLPMDPLPNPVRKLLLPSLSKQASQSRLATPQQPQHVQPPATGPPDRLRPDVRIPAARFPRGFDRTLDFAGPARDFVAASRAASAEIGSSFGFDGPACVIGASRAIAASCHFPGTLYGRCGSSPHSSRNRTARPPPSGCTNSCRTLPSRL